MIEADFRQFYDGADLRDFWRRDSGMTYRWVVSHIQMLPEDSRYIRHLRREDGRTWNQPDHHRQDIVDLLQQVVYFAQISATSGIKKSDHKKVYKNAPKPAVRPGQKPEAKVMSTKQQIREFFNGLGVA